MTREETRRWTPFLAASLLLHAALLARFDLSGGEPGSLPSRLTVLLKSQGDDPSSEAAGVPASAVRSRDLFDRPPAEDATEVARRDEPPPPLARVEPIEPLEPVEPIEPVQSVEPETRETVPAPDAPASAPTAAAASRTAAASPGEAASTAPPQPGASDSGVAERHGRLLSLLHDAISRQQRYPRLALRQRREGTATVSFYLSPNGEMDAIGVDRSSGFSVLDTAAVSAVGRVAPFAPARVYLSDVTRFKVDVTFKLN